LNRTYGGFTEIGIPSFVERSKFNATSAPIALPVLNLLILLAVLTLSVLWVRPPEPVPASAPGGAFSAERAMQHLRVIARAPHPIGTAANQDVREYLINQLNSLGLQTQAQSGIGFSKFHDWLGGINAGYVRNVIGRLPGTANTRAVLLVAHYDSHEPGPGAGDDGSGVAAILEAVRALKAQGPLRNDLIVLFTDGEEPGGLGSDLFANSHPWAGEIGVALNFDAAGDAGPSLMLETSKGNRWLIEEFATAAPYPFASSFFYSVGRRMKGGSPTDLPELMRAGLAGLNFGILANRGHVNHTRLDNVDNLNLASLQHQGSYALALARQFGNLDFSRVPLHSDEDEVFFDWIGTCLVHYPKSWVLPMHFILTGVLAWLLSAALRRRRVRTGAMSKAALACFAALIAIPSLLAGAWWAFDRAFGSRILLGDTPSNWLLFTALIVLAMACAVWIIGYLRWKLGLLNLSAAGILLTWIITTALVLGLSEGSYILFWPLVFATASFPWVSLKERSAVAPLLAAVPALLLFAPVFYVLGILNFVDVGGIGTAPLVAVGFAVALLSFLLAPFISPLAPGPSARHVLPTVLLALTVVLGTWGVVLSRFSPEHPRPDTILYSVNAENNHAVWISMDERVDDWTQQFLTEHPKQGKMPEYQAGLEGNLWNSAPTTNLPSPEVQVLESRMESGLHQLRLRLRSPRHANSVAITLGPGTELIAVNIAGRDPFSDTLRGKPGIPREISIIPVIGLPDEGVEIILKTRCAGHCNIGTYDRSFGLPRLPGFSFRPRPSDIMGWYGSDVTLVGREYRF